jgi:penicillin-binding protein 1A
MAFHMTRKWDKERILRNYLNTIYFGNGAYGIESAARTYFGDFFGLDSELPKCGSANGQRRCASLLQPAQAALIAGVVANPSAYDPAQHPVASRERRDVVLQRMLEQHYITDVDYQDAIRTPLPAPAAIQPPSDTSKYPYFTTWVRQQVVDKVGAGRAFEGGLKIQTTIDPELQEAAQSAITQWLGTSPGVGGVPAAGLVALDNDTSEVLAMVGGINDQYNERPFNLATQGQRQPGSSFKPFILTEALLQGISPYSTWTSAQKNFCVVKKRGKCIENFQVNNYDDNYSGISTLARATTFSDNSVFAEVGIKVGTKKIAHLARNLGVRTPVSTNLAMTLGGLKEGVTVLDMAHAYESFASGGNLVWGSLSPGAEDFDQRDESGTVPGPVGIKKILEPKDPGSDKYRSAKLLNGKSAVNKTRDKRVIPEETAATVQSILSTVVTIGSGKRAAVPGTIVAGKTGTTENYGDAWFVGWTPEYTVAVWVGYPDSVKSMAPPTFDFAGEPVAGGTFPSAIWSTFMRSALAIHPPGEDENGPTGPTGATSAPAPVTTTAPSTTVAPETSTEEAPPVPDENAPDQAEPDTQSAPETPPDEQTAPVPETPATEPEAPPSTDEGGATAPSP